MSFDPDAPGRLTDPILLDYLLHAKGPVSVDALAKKWHLTHSQVTNELGRLRNAGCIIDMHPQYGPTLRSSGLGAWVEYLQWACSLPKSNAPRRVEVYRQTTSTQDAARSLTERFGSEADGALAIADEQTAGRGRLGRTWLAPAATAVLFTRVCAWSQSEPAPTVNRLMLAASVAVARAIESIAGKPTLEVKIKWPNDVLVQGLKIAGILIETAGNAALIGIGINVSIEASQMPAELRDHFTSLSRCARPADRLLLLTETVRQMDRTLKEKNLNKLIKAWRRRCAQLTHRISLRTNGKTVHGTVIDLDPYDGLIVRSDDGVMMHLHAATTTLLSN